mmetsp:Transcript_3258/g.4598  ORF Transcript_3258/g.4598 Transcript_3258/m.4598 type:complete len:496 (-) Transcript_3258:212-1699(-)|eukprot:CAMPEP_0117756376 /NCGR_PEP_ID=MMETSP0947-20121206/14040_1 /TAXON_ID=44440 /ORGANISM="Chattonella subsalsa, Strain CCMP2191" /LENGTH=495 /DNA_ID=CAMNT_0005575949 /DNA_START=99 /DNA_END=1586 /DNA_ORIENTATION=+
MNAKAIWILISLSLILKVLVQAESCESDSGEDICGAVEVTAFKVGDHDDGIRIKVEMDMCEDFSNVENYFGSRFEESFCNRSAPCTIYSEVGKKISSCFEFEDESMVFVVPQGRLFMWPTIEPGRQKIVPHVKSPVDGKEIMVETLSLSPKVYKLHNFFSNEEADALVENALNIKDDANRLKRSSTGAIGYTLNEKRTSDNAFDGDSEVAMMIKRRAIELLGFPLFKDTWLDGMQILRYQLRQAYNKHMDPFELDDDSDGHNYDSTGKGTNRYATILMYLSDVEEGGETVFPEGRPIGLPEEEDVLPFFEALEDVRDKNLTSIFRRNSWEEKMVAECQHRLAVKPVKGEAILFYSQFPDGTIDDMALHGGCPVREGTKWAANLWIWNGPRAGYTTVLEDGTVVDIWNPVPKNVVFINHDIENAQLYWEDSFFSDFPIGQEVGSNSFIGHKWNIRVNNQKPPVQKLMIPHEDHYYENSLRLDIHIRSNQDVEMIPA